MQFRQASTVRVPRAQLRNAARRYLRKYAPSRSSSTRPAKLKGMLQQAVTASSPLRWMNVSMRRSQRASIPAELRMTLLENTALLAATSFPTRQARSLAMHTSETSGQSMRTRICRAVPATDVLTMGVVHLQSWRVMRWVQSVGVSHMTEVGKRARLLNREPVRPERLPGCLMIVLRGQR